MPGRIVNARGHGDLLRGEIVLGAVRLLDRTGVVPSLRGIAEEVGIAAPSIYRHFPSLDAILVEVVDVSFEQLQRDLETAAASASEDPVERLLAVVRAYVVFGRALPGRYGLMFGPGGFTPRVVATLEMAERLLAACHDDPDAADGDDAGEGLGRFQEDAFLLWTGVHGYVLAVRPDRIDDLVDDLVSAEERLKMLVRRLARLP